MPYLHLKLHLAYMKNKIIFLTTVSIFWVIGNLFAQSEEKAIQQSTWFAYIGSIKLNDHWHINPYAEFRRQDNLREWQQWLGQISIGRRFGNFGADAGYTFVSFHPYGRFPIKYKFDEHRHWEQITHKHKLGDWQIDHRLRWEHRWLERRKFTSNDELATSWLYKNRWRQRIRFKKNIGKNYLTIISNETFFSQAKETPFNFSQNRFRASVFREVNEHFSIGLGYMTQHIWRRSKYQTEVNHTILLDFKHNI